MSDAPKKCCPDEPAGKAPAKTTELPSLLRLAAVEIPAEDDYCVVADAGGPLNQKLKIKIRGKTLRLVGFNDPPETWIAATPYGYADANQIPLTPTLAASGAIGAARKVVDATPGNYQFGALADSSVIYIDNPCPAGQVTFGVILWHIYRTPFHSHVLIETASFTASFGGQNCPAGGFGECDPE